MKIDFWKVTFVRTVSPFILLGFQVSESSPPVILLLPNGRDTKIPPSKKLDSLFSIEVLYTATSTLKSLPTEVLYPISAVKTLSFPSNPFGKRVKTPLVADVHSKLVNAV